MECLYHKKQVTIYLPESHTAICPDCDAVLEPQVEFGDTLKALKDSILETESEILANRQQINVQMFRESKLKTNALNKSLQDSIQGLFQLQAQFWLLPQVKLVIQNQSPLDWTLLQKYGVVGYEIQVSNFAKISQFLRDRLAQIKQTEQSIVQKIQLTREPRLSKGNSQQFEAIQDESSGQDAQDLSQISIPEALKLQESFESVTLLLKDKQRDQPVLPSNNKPLPSVPKRKDQQKQPEQGQLEDKTASDSTQAPRQQLPEAVQSEESMPKEQQIAHQIMRLVLEAKSNLEVKNLDSAQKNVEAILKIDPKNINALRLRAKLLLCNNYTSKEAQDIYENQICPDNLNSNDRYQLAQIYLQGGYLQQSKALIDKIFKDERELKAEYYSLKGDWYIKSLSRGKPWENKILEKSEKIYSCYVKANELSPKNPELLYKMYMWNCNQGQWEIALSFIREAISLDPKNIQFLKSRASVLRKLEKFPNAIEDYSQVRRCIQTKETINNHAILLYLGSKWDYAKQEILNAYDQFPSDLTIVINCLILLPKLKQTEKAVQIIRSTAKDMRQDENWVIKAVGVILAYKQVPDAQFLLNELISERNLGKPRKCQFYIGLYSLALYLRNQDVVKDGIKVVPQLIAKPQTDLWRPQLWNLLGLLKSSMGDAKLEEFKMATNFSQNMVKPTYLWNYAVALFTSQRYKESLQVMQRLLARKSANKRSDYQEFRIILLIHLQEYSKAEDLLKNFLATFQTTRPKETFNELFAELRQRTQIK